MTGRHRQNKTPSTDRKPCPSVLPASATNEWISKLTDPGRRWLLPSVTRMGGVSPSEPIRLSHRWLKVPQVGPGEVWTVTSNSWQEAIMLDTMGTKLDGATWWPEYTWVQVCEPFTRKLIFKTCCDLFQEKLMEEVKLFKPNHLTDTKTLHLRLEGWSEPHVAKRPLQESLLRFHLKLYVSHTSCFICENENRHHNCQCHYHLRTIRAAGRERLQRGPWRRYTLIILLESFLFSLHVRCLCFAPWMLHILRYISVKLIMKLRCFQLSFILEIKTTLKNTFLSLCCAGLPPMLTSAYLFTLLTFALEMKNS